jgi:hypothetical protein
MNQSENENRVQPRSTMGRPEHVDGEIAKLLMDVLEATAVEFSGRTSIDGENNPDGAGMHAETFRVAIIDCENDYVPGIVTVFESEHRIKITWHASAEEVVLHEDDAR